MKYLLKTALCLLLCALLSLPALAEEGEEMEERTCGDYTYVLLEDGGARITGYDGEGAELTIPDELDGHPVREIGDYAFFWCDTLTSIMLPGGLTSIGDSAFSRCDSLTSVALPDSLTNIGPNPFVRCDSLAKIDVSPDNHAFAKIDGVLYEKATKTLICYPAGKAGNTFAVPEGILAIGDSAFFFCESLTSITLPDSLTSIGDEAFYHCESLTSIALPDSLTSIGDEAFASCNALTAITLPNSLLSIGDEAFAYCDLTTVTLPDSLSSIGDEAFAYCDLTSIMLSDNLTSIGANPFSCCDSLAKIDVSPDHPVFEQIDGVLYEKATKTLICYPTGKAGNAFTVPEGILAIGDSAFQWCGSLTTITLPDSLTSIDDEAFYSCYSLTTIRLPNSLTSIGNEAFYHCNSLTTITLPDSVTSIGEDAFSECDILTLTVSRDSYACQYAIDNGLVYTYPDANDWLYA